MQEFKKYILFVYALERGTNKMDVRNCKTCGRIFNYVTGQPICPRCEALLEEKFHEVKQYIYDNPGVGMNEVSEECDVSVNQIRHWVREERLAFSSESAVGIECEKCGAMILTGRFCKVCKDKMSNSFSSIYRENKPEQPEVKDQRSKARMRFLE